MAYIMSDLNTYKIDSTQQISLGYIYTLHKIVNSESYPWQ